jgi:hypothetical protein
MSTSGPPERDTPPRSAGRSCLLLVGLLALIPVIFTALIVFVAFVIFSDVGILHTMSSRRLNRLDLAIEAFHIETGEYPATLKHLELPSNEIYDVTRGLWTSGAAGNYYYRRSEDGQHFEVLGVGWDGMPFTDDDLVPER